MPINGSLNYTIIPSKKPPLSKKPLPPKRLLYLSWGSGRGYCGVHRPHVYLQGVSCKTAQPSRWPKRHGSVTLLRVSPAVYTVVPVHHSAVARVPDLNSRYRYKVVSKSVVPTKVRKIAKYEVGVSAICTIQMCQSWHCCMRACCVS